MPQELLNKLISNSPVETLVLTDVQTLKDAFTGWLEQYEVRKRTDESNTLLTKRKAAERLGVDISTLWRWNKEKYLCPVKKGVRSYYRLSDIIAIEKGSIEKE